jgi:hypothetical protein
VDRLGRPRGKADSSRCSWSEEDETSPGYTELGASRLTALLEETLGGNCMNRLICSVRLQEAIGYRLCLVLTALIISSKSIIEHGCPRPCQVFVSRYVKVTVRGFLRRCDEGWTSE